MEPLFTVKKSATERAFRLAGKIILYLLTAILLFIVSALSYDRFVKKSPVPSVFGYSVLVIATGSMETEISAGDAVVIKRSDSYAVGDVISYFPAGESVTVTHRIVRTEGDRFYTKGDANPSEDPDPVYKGQIVGKVTFRIPVVGKVAEWLKTTEGMLFLAAAIVLIALIVAVAKQD